MYSGLLTTALLALPAFSSAHAIHNEPLEHSLVPRATQCGPDVGSCPSGSCCNKRGECGTEHEFCSGAGNCQVDYSDNCEEQRMPGGPSLVDLPRPKIGNVPYGRVITQCSKPGSIALAFDDGPAKNFSAKVLDLLDSYNMKATFFVTGHDFAQPIDDPDVEYAAVLRRMHASGHQIGHHSWTHENLTRLNDTRLRDQMHYNEMALRNVLGFIPTYLRPPYLSCKEDCPQIVGDLGYHIITTNLDTKDFDNNKPELIQTSKDAFAAYFEGGNYTAASSVVLTLNHDIRVQTAYNLTDYMLNYMVTNNLPRSITVGECLDDPAENWYRDAGEPLLSEDEIKPIPSSSGSSASSTGGASSGAVSGQVAQQGVVGLLAALAATFSLL